ncbi:hypothetical protein CFP65_3737 [Kitasatospora sp. MMS16-BH015]|uniref:hypothetical protein n=1 Tax=Kitasatospora sp. MMS16-BH015 TaxID=2018025 RepID=UPI000CA2FE21|nr:hypothetical protein [Kitasatospora sp. MMS16-BH015]AUG78523.1 hypothetical protein CFP65_3737 [Kitasatospora sp. MMS16-BH015]
MNARSNSNSNSDPAGPHFRAPGPPNTHPDSADRTDPADLSGPTEHTNPTDQTNLTDHTGRADPSSSSVPSTSPSRPAHPAIRGASRPWADQPPADRPAPAPSVPAAGPAFPGSGEPDEFEALLAASSLGAPHVLSTVEQADPAVTVRVRAALRRASAVSTAGPPTGWSALTLPQRTPPPYHWVLPEAHGHRHRLRRRHHARVSPVAPGVPGPRR